MNAGKKIFYEDPYASLSVIESVPCVKVKLSGFPRGSEHYRFVQSKLLETILTQIGNFCRLHLLTDSAEAGLVLEEDMTYFKNTIVPRMEEAGIRYHAIVLPQKFFAGWIKKQTSISPRKLKIEYFDQVVDAKRWLKMR